MPEKYRLPFDAEKHGVNILQGRNGPYSHFVHPSSPEKSGIDLANAVDFIVPLGTEVLAARVGTFMGGAVKSNVVYEGTDPEEGNSLPYGSTNYIAINHGDGTIAIYSHIAENGSYFSSSGTPIEQGQPIAVTGKSGWMGPTPHLHFQVVNFDSESIPVEFEGYDGPLEHSELEELTEDVRGL